MKPESEKGYLVETYDGKKGRIFHEKNTLNGKIIVHLEVANHYDPRGTLYYPDQVKIIGFID